MTVDVIIPESFTRFMQLLKPSGRHSLFSAAGNAVSKLVNDYLKFTVAPTHHKTADRLGATRTGHYEPRATFAATGSSATVTIPIPGISRAFKNLSIAPKKAAFLTLPLSSVAYGKRAARVRQLGYTIFRPPAKGAHKAGNGKFDKYKDILMGSKDGETIPLYLLKKRVEQQQDRSLLPSDAAISQAASSAMAQVMSAYAEGAA